MNRKEALEALEGCWDGNREDGLKIKDLIEAHFDMVERVCQIISEKVSAKVFHESYERLAPLFDYNTRKESAVDWKDVPIKNKKLMIAVCTEIQQAVIKATEAL